MTFENTSMLALEIYRYLAIRKATSNFLLFFLGGGQSWATYPEQSEHAGKAQSEISAILHISILERSF